MARIDKERTREIKKQAMLIKEQTTDAGKWNETMQSIYDMSAKNAEIRMRLQASFQRIQDMNAAPERDKAAIEKEYGNFSEMELGSFPLNHEILGIHHRAEPLCQVAVLLRIPS